MTTLTIFHKSAGLCLVAGLLLLTIIACGDSESEPAPQPTTAAVGQGAPAPTSMPAAAAPTSAPAPTAAPATAVPSQAMVAEPDSEPSNIVVGAPFSPSSNGAIETDDSFILSRAGATETLVRIDFDGQVKPFLAESWSLRDGNSWEFKLREGVSFHDGAPFDSAAVVAALDYLRGVPNPPRGFTEDTLQSVTAEGSHTVVVTSGAPDVLLPTRLAAPTTGILTPASYEGAGDVPPSIIRGGTGPFTIEADISIESLSMANFADYRDGAAALDSGEFLFVPDGLVRSAMLETGEVDYLSHLPISQLPIFLDNPDFTVRTVQQPRTVTLYVNNRNGAFSDVNVRKAAQHALDKQAIVDSVLEGSGEPAVGAFAPSEAWVNSDLVEYEFNPETAKEFLAEAGYEEGELKVSLWTYPSRAEFPAMAVAIHEMLNDAGFSAEIRLAPWGALVDDVFAGNFDMFLVSRGHLIDAYDPEGFFTADYSCASVDVSNYSNYCNPEVDELLEQARPMSDLDARYDIYREVQRILHEEAVNPFINYTEQNFVYANHVENWRPHLLEYYLMTTELDVSR